MFVVFVLEIYPVEVTAMLGAAVLVLAGIVPSDGVLKVFSNPAPWTIAAMFIVSGGLVRTGLINSFARTVSRHAAQQQDPGARRWSASSSPSPRPSPTTRRSSR